MTRCLMMMVVPLLIALGATTARGQTTDEVKQLRKEIELQERELKVTRAENESLKKQVAELEGQIKQLKAGGVTGGVVAKPLIKDAFAVGAVFTGRRTMGEKVEQELTMKVTKRDGTSFEGKITIVYRPKNEILTVKVTGTAEPDSGAVEFTTEKSGEFQQTFTGNLDKGEIGFKCKGTARDGADVTGKGYMKK